MPEKILIHAAYPLWRKNFLVTVARARQLKTEGHDVQMTYCDAKGGTCAVNYLGNPLTCRVCKSVVKDTAKNAGLPVIALSPDDVDQPSVSQKEMQEILEGVLSGLISTFRLLAEDVSASAVLKRVKKRYFRTSLGLLKSFRQLVAEEQPDRVEVFNGRHACSKFYLIEAIRSEIPFNTIEIKGKGLPVVFKGHTAHDRAGIQRRVMTHDADMEMAEEFFSNRRNPKHNKFAVKNAKLEPPKTTGSGRKVTFFLSSQDEFAALGKNWESPFDDNADVIANTCRRFPEDSFCVRFHPNQADIGSDFLKPYEALKDIPNVQLYLPLDAISSYELIDWSDVVITFGSTVTIEACWAGKPVVLLGPSMYDQLELAENPETMDEFLQLLTQEISPRDRTNAARFVKYALTDREPFPDLNCDNGNVKANGFKRSHPVASKVARCTEVVVCQILKRLARRGQTTLSQPRKAG